MKLKLFFILIIIYKLLLNQVSAGIIFSEIFPNTLDDKNLEYIELYNSGIIDLSLSGFILKDKSDKEYLFSSGFVLLSEEKKQFLRIETKITLNNTNEELFLYDNFGILIDYFSYSISTKSEPIIILNNQANILNEEVLNSNHFENNDVIKLKKIVHRFQSPTYLTDKDEYKVIYNCDKTKEECRVNLNFRDSFIGDINYSDYKCTVLLGNINLGGNDTCNPLTITIPEGIHEIKILVINKIDSLDVQKKILTFVNKKNNKNVIIKNKNTGIKSVIISKPNIIIQSGLNNKNECSNKNNCNINLKYNIKSKFEKCRWDFGLGIFESGINTKCNPGRVKYGTGEFIIKLRVFEKGNYFNYKESELQFSNIFKKKLDINNNVNKNKLQTIESQSKSLSGKILPYKNVENLNNEEIKIKKEPKEEKINNIKSIITLQGKIGKDKEVNGNIITCYNTCNINFDGSLSSGNIYRYSWDFGNGERFKGKNPGYMQYNKVGKYIVYLLTEGKKGERDLKTFYVNFLENNEIKEKKEDENIKKENITKDYSIGLIKKVSANNEYGKIENNNSKTAIILLYVLIFIFGLILIVLILKKEKLL